MTRSLALCLSRWRRKLLLLRHLPWCLAWRGSKLLLWCLWVVRNQHAVGAHHIRLCDGRRWLLAGLQRLTRLTRLALLAWWWLLAR